MIKIKQLFDEITKQKVYPLTTIKAVKDPSTKKSLAELLLVGEDVSETQDTPTKDADTLGGKYRASDIDKSMTYDENESTEVVEDVEIVDADRLGGKYTASDIDVIKQDIDNANSNIIDIYVGDDGKLHKVQGGADSVLPFKKGFIPETAIRNYTVNYVTSLEIVPNFTGKALLFVTSYANSVYIEHSLESGMKNAVKLLQSYGSSGVSNTLWIGDVTENTPISITSANPSSWWTNNLVQIGE